MRHPSFQRGDTRCENKTAAVNISSSKEVEEEEEELTKQEMLH